MEMCAVIQEVWENSLLVLDLHTRQQVVVNTSEAGRFRSGWRIRICYNGIMTRSLPPQIYGETICVLSCC